MLAPDDAARVLMQNGADIRDVAELVALHGDGLAIRLNDTIALPASDLGDSLDHVLREHHELAVGLDEAVIDVGPSDTAVFEGSVHGVVVQIST